MSRFCTTALEPSSPTPEAATQTSDDQPIPFALTDRPFALFEEAALEPGTHLVHKRYGDLTRAVYDPAQITRDEAGALLAVFHGLYTEARLFGELGDVRLLNAELPHGEPIRRIETTGHRTWVWDDQQVYPQQMLDILRRVHAQAGE